MKKASYFGLVACCLLGSGGAVWAAQPDKVQCRQGLVLTEIQPVDFGGFFASGAGTVTLDPLTGGRSVTGPITLATAGGNVGQYGIVEVSVTVDPGIDCSPYPISITLPRNVTLSDAVGNTLTINAWASEPTDGNLYLGPNNMPVQLYVGATATVGAGQVGGHYSGTYTVRMMY